MPPATASKVVYYSPTGGAVIAALDEADSEYEESLRTSGVAFKKHTCKASDVEGRDLQRCRVRPEYDKDGKATGKQKVEVDA